MKTMSNEKESNLKDKVLELLKSMSGEKKEVDEKEEYEDEKTSKSNSSLLDTVNEVFSLLAHSEIQVHLWHLQTKGTGSYAMHKALNEYYETIIDLRDTFVESAISRAGRPKSIKCYDYVDYSDNWCCDHFDMLCKKFYEITENMSEYKDLENICADILQLLHKTKYLLTLP